MEFSAKQIAEFLNGRVVGDENQSVHTFAKIEEGVPGAISFLANSKYTHYIYETKSSVVLINDGIELNNPVNATLIIVKDAYDSIAKLLQLYESAQPKDVGIDKLAFISEKAEIGKNVYIGPFAYIGDGVRIGDNARIYPHTTILKNCVVGKNCSFYPHVTIYHDCKIGNRVTIHAGSVIGADGFGFAPTAESYDKIPQIGIVTIEDDVEIGANSCVDRATMGSTYLRKGVKIDNLVQIAHNTDIGKNTVISAQTGVAGSTKVGENCMFGGQVGISGHIRIGNRVLLGAQSGVPGGLRDNQVLIGTPPMEEIKWFKSQAIFRKLPELYKEISQLQKEVEELKSDNNCKKQRNNYI